MFGELNVAASACVTGEKVAVEVYINSNRSSDDNTLVQQNSVMAENSPAIISPILKSCSQNESFNKAIRDDGTWNLCVSMINYVRRTQCPLLIANASEEKTFCDDNYVKLQNPKSILVLPIVHQGKLVSMLYLENNFTTGAFTANRLEVLNLLSTQIAVSFQNARLFLQSNHLANQAFLAKEEAEKANKAKSDFISNMSHEMRTPLNHIIGSLELLKEFPLTTDQKELLNISQQSSESLLFMVNNILDLSKVEQGKTVLNLSIFNLVSFLEDSIGAIAPNAHQKGLMVGLYSTPCSSSIPVIGDVNLLRQILVNLLSNAIKFTSKGEVFIKVSVSPNLNNTSYSTQIEVTDSGIGIKPKDFDKLFQRFSQLDTGVNRAYDGSGLGLSICKQLVELMGGHIGIRNNTMIRNQIEQIIESFGVISGSSTFTNTNLSQYLSMDEILIKNNNIVIIGLPLNYNEDQVLSLIESIQQIKEKYHKVVEIGGGNRNRFDFIVITQLALTSSRSILQESGILLVNRPIKRDSLLNNIIKIIESYQITSPSTLKYTKRLMKSPQLIRSINADDYNEMKSLWLDLQQQQQQQQQHQQQSAVVMKQYQEKEKSFPPTQSKNLSPTKNGVISPPFRRSPTISPHRRAPQILVIEDNEVNSNILFKMLQKMGITSLDLASNGAEGVEKASNIDYDLILMDIQMPIMDGYEATSRIRKSEGTFKHTPIVAMTANAMGGQREACLQAGCDDYFCKPLKQKDLEGMMNQINIIQKISPSEIYFIKQGVECGVRSDGRSRLDYRHFELDVGEIAHACGSARILLSNTHVLVGIKADIGAPTTDKPNSGVLNYSVECCPSASPEFEGKGAEQLNIELAKQLERMLENSLDLESLVIVPGRYCWNLHIDATVLDSDGNLFDALSIVTRAALFNTRLPTIKVVQGEHEQIEFEVSEDSDTYQSLSIENVPICVTLTKVGTQFLIDSTLEEELCMEARLTIGINKKSNICSIQKGGMNGLDANTVNQMINVAKQVSMK
ncbi:hypothetical protein PPL_10049 [Heterostelium album PN500]|uniref:histidine kinase n=1 Tax=Heterostelium pallidum (strain ATCC 26659 / Pp 5 / PN500) TaxID=670386 RepID=D3BQ66_HETP5|nr:hypothetical protein PPL_10049 [Heterostelium album PN500]EFA76286.1 hypothetical protein PPL_10049 [Heterostelium album PN500]|eukprot:XP_020428418.1 hypothetical protein PPL_10049 [Heterostelium album PN500]